MKFEVELTYLMMIESIWDYYVPSNTSITQNDDVFFETAKSLSMPVDYVLESTIRWQRTVTWHVMWIKEKLYVLR